MAFRRSGVRAPSPPLTKPCVTTSYARLSLCTVGRESPSCYAGAMSWKILHALCRKCREGGFPPRFNGRARPRVGCGRTTHLMSGRWKRGMASTSETQKGKPRSRICRSLPLRATSRLYSLCSGSSMPSPRRRRHGPRICGSMICGPVCTSRRRPTPAPAFRPGRVREMLQPAPAARRLAAADLLAIEKHSQEPVVKQAEAADGQGHGAVLRLGRNRHARTRPVETARATRPARRRRHHPRPRGTVERRTGEARSRSAVLVRGRIGGLGGNAPPAGDAGPLPRGVQIEVQLRTATQRDCPAGQPVLPRHRAKRLAYVQAEPKRRGAQLDLIALPGNVAGGFGGRCQPSRANHQAQAG
jgi:hypothetical protein